MFAEAQSVYRASGQTHDEVLALSYLSFFSRMQGDMDAADRFAREAVVLAEPLEDDRARSAAAIVMGDVHSAQGQHDFAFARYEEAVELRIRLADPLLVTDAVYSLGMAAFRARRFKRAREAFSEALDAGARSRRGALRRCRAADARRARSPRRRRRLAARRAQRASLCTPISRTTAHVLAASSFSPGRPPRSEIWRRLHGWWELRRLLGTPILPTSSSCRSSNAYVPMLEAEIGRPALDELEAEGRRAEPEIVLIDAKP